MGTVSIAGTNYEIYGTSTEANDYLKARIAIEPWSSANATDKDKALVSATRLLDRQNWTGQKTQPAPTQVLEFPRTGLIDKDGNAVSSVDVPLLVEEGNYELALQILGDPAVQGQQTTGSNTKSVKAGSVGVSFFRPTEGTKLPITVHELVGVFLEGSGLSDLTGPFVSGTDGESTFSDIDQWGRIRGFP